MGLRHELPYCATRAARQRVPDHAVQAPWHSLLSELFASLTPKRATAVVLALCCAACTVAPSPPPRPLAPAPQAEPVTAPPVQGPADSSARPVLRIEAGAHVAAIHRIATDRTGRIVVTASADNTARVWDQASGRLLRVLRPPLLFGASSFVASVAISPDGKTLAIGGLGSPGAGVEQPVYLFDLASGSLQRRLGGADNVPIHLAFSPDGRWLAATLHRRGIRVWDWRSGSAPLADTEYGSPSASLDWSRDGRLVASSFDGKLRLYRLEVANGAARLSKLAEAEIPEGGTLGGVAFHPDGQQIAVGLVDRSAVVIVDAQRLQPVHWPDVHDIPQKLGLSSVAWSRDGRSLAAGGRWSVNGRHPVRLWPDAGRGAPHDVASSEQTIADLTALPTGGWLLGSGDGGWGVIDGAGQWVARSTPSALALAVRPATFLLARSGRQVQMPVVGASSPLVFDLDARTLASGRLGGGAEPLVSGLPVENWRGQTQPTFRGQPLAMVPSDRAFAMAVAPGQSSFVLGTNSSLRHYDGASGTLLWTRKVAGATRGVNVLREGSRAGKVVVATFTDGTLRWYRLSDGRELLALFMHADMKRWVLWTPGGYFDASPGAEDLIGWHVNRGPYEMADFYAASRFRARFQRPDVIDRVLEVVDEATAVAQADAAVSRRAPQAQAQAVENVLPPVVTVLSGAEMRATAAQLTLRVSGRSAADAPVTGLRVRINGQASNEFRSAAVAGSDERELTLSVPPRDSEVQVFAENRHGTSAAATVRVQWAGATAPQSAPGSEAFQFQPKLYALAVGVGAYVHASVSKLAFPAKDARDFAAALQRQKGRLYREVEVKLLTDAQATREGVVDGLDWLQRQVTQHDVGMVFVAGHGLNDPDLGYAFLPVNTDPERLRTTAVPMEEFRKTLSRLPGKALFFFDTCHSGNVLGPRARSAFGNDVRAVINELSSAENGVVVFSSSTGRQLSYEDNAWGNGAFTKALVEGLDGKADFQKTGRITHKMLDLYVSERVKDLTQGRQSPVTQAPGGVPDYPVAWVRDAGR